MQEGKKYFSGKHKLYGFETEASVLPNGLALFSSKHYPGSVSDIDIMSRNRELHNESLLKGEGETDLTDVGDLSDRFSEYWAPICEKGYQCAAKFLTVVMPRKKPRNGRWQFLMKNTTAK